MQHRHFPQIPSTQIYLRDHLEEFTDNEVLISCTEQTNGIGRTGNDWDFYPNSLAMSFLIKPHATPTLTPIEIALHILSFFKINFNKNVLLKWPNDLMTEDLKKCGGIICNYVDEKKVIAGIGINFTSPTIEYPYPTSDIRLSTQTIAQDLSLEIYNFILKNRINSADNIVTEFNASCAHQNKIITFDDGSTSYRGIFKGINNRGEAILEINGIPKSFLSGSLIL